MPAYPFPVSSTPPLSTELRRALLRLAANVHKKGFSALSAPLAVRPVQSVLLIRPDHLGDLLFLGPALHWLRRQKPDWRLTLAIGPWGRPALPALNGAYDELLILPFPAFERGKRAGLWTRWRLLPQWARRLKAAPFDAALIFRPDHWWGAMLATLAGIPQRLGFETPETDPWLTQALPLTREHAVASNLRLVGAALDQTPSLDPALHPLRFALDERDVGQVEAMLRSLGVSAHERLIVVHPGSGAAIKLWEPGKWGDVIRRLSQKHVRVAVTGGPDEVELAGQVCRFAGEAAINLAGRTSFGELAALLARSDLALGPDSGPLNLAVATGTPTVHLFGPADPVLFGPWGDPARHIVLQSNWSCIPCGRFDWPDLPAHGCVRDISVEQVTSAALRLLGLDS